MRIDRTDRADARDPSGRSPADKSKQPAPATAPDGCSDLPGHLALWTGGTVDFGSRNGMVERNGAGFNTEGVTLGADYRVNDLLVFGVGGGYGHDRSDIGNDGTRSTAESYSIALYASFRPLDQLFLDGTIGTGSLAFDSVRFAADADAFATGHRSGEQNFASLTTGYLLKDEGWHLTPLWPPRHLQRQSRPLNRNRPRRPHLFRGIGNLDRRHAGLPRRLRPAPELRPPRAELRCRVRT